MRNNKNIWIKNNQGNEIIIKSKNSEERLRTKALDHKCRQLIEENERLMEKLCEAEMRRGEGEDIQETCRQLEGRIREVWTLFNFRD